MNIKNEKKIKAVGYRAFLFGTTLASIAAYFFYTSNSTAACDDKNKTAQSATAFTNTIPTLFIKEDSLNTLLSRFYNTMNTHLSYSNSTGNLFHIKLKRFGENQIAFYNNPKLFKPHNQGFNIIQTPEGDIECNFIRKKMDGDYYVEVPSDILFRLFRNIL